MKKLRLSLAALLVAAVFAGCSSSPTTSATAAAGPSYDGGGFVFGSGNRADTMQTGTTTQDGGGFVFGSGN